MMNNTEIVKSQLQECVKRNIQYLESPFYLMVGLAQNFDPLQNPINGLRHPPEGETTGWYIWSGEQFPDQTDSFEPVHCIHLFQQCPRVIKYLGLPPGWRFLFTENYEDIWSDESLIEIEPSANNNLFDYFKKNRREFLGNVSD